MSLLNQRERGGGGVRANSRTRRERGGRGGSSGDTETGGRE